MSQSRRFFIIFTAFVGLSTFAMALISARALDRAYSLFATSPNKELAAVLWPRMAFDAKASMLSAALIIMAIAIPIGIGLWRISSRRQVLLMQRLESLAQERLGFEGRLPTSHNRKNMWEDFATILIRDLEQIRDREKIESWKQGARMLMHELKNPMTPLKLSAQSLAMDGIEAGGAVRRILEATESMERILGYFKNLVNIDFGAKEDFAWHGYLSGISQDMQAAGKAIKWNETYFSDEIVVEAEKILLRMVIENLVNNGLEACRNPLGITIVATETDACMEMEIHTPGAILSDPDRIFQPGHSTKGNGRGYGLFLCKLISNYLNLGIWFRQDPKATVFGFRIPKSDQGSI